MNIPREARLRALHNRHHTNRGIVREGCTFCALPNVKGIPKNVPVSAVKPAQKQSVDEELKVFKEKMAFREAAWTCAQAGLSLTEAARTCKLQLQAFAPMVEEEFKENYPSLVETARLDNLRAITLAALRAAKEGDVRLLLRLEEKGIFANWLEREKDHATSIRGTTTAELEERMRAYFEPRRPYTNLSPTVSLQDVTSEEAEEFEQVESQIIAESGDVNKAVDFARPNLQVEELTKSERESSPLTHTSDSTSREKPVIAVPESTSPLSIQARRF